MTSTLSFTQTSSPNPATPERLAEVLANPGFGQHFTDHMVTIRWSNDQGWHSAELEPYHPLTLDPAATVLHYGQAIFEGLKAYRHQDGSIVAFRPEANAERFQNSARRMAMPELPTALFIESLHQLLAVDGRWVPDRAEASLYLRPFMISDESTLGVNRPANHYLYALIASPAGPYFATGVKPVKVWLCTDYVRAAPGGTGAAKCAGNYAASFVAQAQAVEQGCDQVVWLDAVERRWVEEVGAMNLFFVFGNRLVTPELSGSLLPGITRDSLLTLARDHGYTVEERRVSTEEWEKKAESGELTEVFGCGTAAVITPVGSVKSTAGEFTIGGGQPGEVTMKLRQALNDLQRGAAPDPHNWLHRLA
ncbi:branched-chain amino acid aminotransferase [Kibdelosporangium aridum]|uniref:Branched-chain-amino-acid aminotransferase n=1 Tax=Kibdelosporangium aridum TaxID=2030 RepID=A0A1Y5Y0I1_KIBAR|nr:branched-chain amino acid aminotransferase [Kibdelosporangium aridum]RSM78958.1 branched-chain amino acid aminotransferase [Kibdelosporangium aridum]SMD23269.1 branched-chain amino acid aminotransferase [Kibdelosporangium aridum]